MSTPKRICSIEGCGRKHKGHGLCALHLRRQRKHGSTDDPRPTLAEGFWSKVDVRGPDECWPWLACGNGHGYGSFRSRGAHIVAYELLVGPVPEGLQLDHTCHNLDLSCLGGETCAHRRCVNPAHLEAVLGAVNTARSRNSPSTVNAAKTRCLAGHSLNAANTYHWRGRRRCRECQRLAARRYRAQRARSIQ